MLQSDYILRLIEQVGTLLRRMLKSRGESPEEALQTAEEALRLTANAEPSLVDALTPESLVTFLAAGGELDAARAVLLARVLEARADAFEATGHAAVADAQREKPTRSGWRHASRRPTPSTRRSRASTGSTWSISA